MATTQRVAQSVDFTDWEKSIHEIEKQSKSLEEVTKWTESIESTSRKIADRVRITRGSLTRQVDRLNEALFDLKVSFAQTRSDGAQGLVETKGQPPLTDEDIPF